MDAGMVEMLSVLEKLGDTTYDASSGEALDDELIKIARRIEMETFKKHGVYEKIPLEESRGRNPSESSG